MAQHRSSDEPTSGTFSIPVIGPGAVSSLMPMLDAVNILDAAFAAGLPAGPSRSSYDTGNAELLIMPAWATQGIGVKLVTLNRANADRGLPLVYSCYVLFDPQTSAPIALVDGGSLTAIRTAALSAVATRRLASPDSGRLVIFGAGVQAKSHINAMTAVLPITECIIVSRTPERLRALVGYAIRRGLSARPGRPTDVRYADIICTCTTSSTPVFDGRDLPSRVHLNVVGSHKPGVREVDAESVASASVWIENASALPEAGDLLGAVDEKRFELDDVRELGELCRGEVDLDKLGSRTLFKSVGLAAEDLAIAAEVVRRWSASKNREVRSAGSAEAP